MDGEFQLPRLRKPRAVPRGLEAWLERGAGAWQRTKARRLNLGMVADEVLKQLAGYEGRRNEHVDRALAEARLGWTRRRSRNAAWLAHTLAVIAVAAERELGLTPHREQIMGVLGLERGWLLEMATGEGKTLTLAMAAVLTGWRGRACHILTANDYLAGRDAKALAGFYRRCGLRVAPVTGGMPPAERVRGYEAGVVYTTSRELVGDFLRDRLRLGRRVTEEGWRPWLQRQRGQRPAVILPRLHTVLVDEADQVLVDEAVTPLIISAPSSNDYLADLCKSALAEASELEEGCDFTVDVAKRQARVDRRVSVDRAQEGRHPLLRVPRWREEWLGKALVALRCHEAGKHYFVREAKVVLIDEATGRPMADRTLGEGMHALLEAKEGLAVTAPTETVASLSFQRFFRQVPRLAGVTGTAVDAAAEFWRLYRLVVVALPTHRPVRRQVRREEGFPNEEAKWNRVAELAKVAHARGQPLLIGTRTVSGSEAVGLALTATGLPFTLLNAVRNEREAETIAAAGQAGQITIATNMAGRGTDIVPTEPALECGGLCVIATERHASSRVDRQLYGRSARQGQPGDVVPLASWEDEVIRHHVPAWWRRAGGVLGATGWLLRWTLRFAQWRAGRRDASRRAAVLLHDTWLDENLSLGAAARDGATPSSRDSGVSSRSRSLQRRQT